jgi:hypothetical protein
VFHNIFWRSCCLWDNVEKYWLVESGRRQVTIWHIRIAYWIPKATNTYSEYVTLIFYCKNCCTNVPQRYVLRIVPASVRTAVFRVVFRNLNLSNREQIWNILSLLTVWALCFLFSENSTLQQKNVSDCISEARVLAQCKYGCWPSLCVTVKHVLPCGPIGNHNRSQNNAACNWNSCLDRVCTFHLNQS